MKNKIWILVVAALMQVGCAGMQPITDAERTFDAIFEVPGFTKDQIFNSTKIWIAENFHSAKAVLEFENKEQGVLIGNGSIKYPCSGLECLAKDDWSIPFTMRVDMKDGKFKLTFSNLRLSWPPSYNSTYGASSGHDAPINQRGDLLAAKPKLLDFGNEIIAAVQKNSGTKDW
jgi:hypothetical protein